MRRSLYALLPALLLLVGAAAAQIVGSLPFNLQNNTTADASQVMANFNAIVSGTNTNSAKNGVNSDITQLSALSTPLTRAQGGTSTYIATATAGGSANAQTIAATSPTFSLDAGAIVQFVPVGTNTGPATLNVAGTGTLNIYRLTPSGLVALSSGELVSGSTARVLYNGTQYQLLTDATAGVPPATVLYTAAATADSGYLLLQGQEISRETYAALYARIGTTYGAGDGTNTFNLPDVRGRTIFSVDDGAGRIDANGLGGALASTMGSQTIAQNTLPNATLTVTGTVTNTSGFGGSPVAPTNTGGSDTDFQQGTGISGYHLNRFTTFSSAFSSGATSSINGGVGQQPFYPPAIVLNAVMKY
jgi:microcystin-dependent protein